MLKETEISYILNILKEKKGDGKLKPDQIKITEKKKYYDQAVKTLEIQMAKLGLTDMYKMLIRLYNTQMVTHFEETLIKLLYRCLIAW